LAFRQHGIKNRHDSVIKITAWAQGHFHKSLSVNAVRWAIHKCCLKLCCEAICEHDPEIRGCMVWGCISAHGTADFHIWKGAIILEQNMLPSR